MAKEDLLPYILKEAQDLERRLDSLVQALNNNWTDVRDGRTKLREFYNGVERHLKELGTLASLASEIRRDAEREIKRKGGSSGK